MTTATDLKCADRISAIMAAREVQLKTMAEKYEETGYYGDEESIYELALSVDTVKVTKVCLSYGGPSDYIEIEHDLDGVRKMTYRFSDWFDTATLEIEEGSFLWNYGILILEGIAQ